MPAGARGLQANWSEVTQLLQAEQYVQAAELLNTIYITANQAGNHLVASSAIAASQICLSCRQLPTLVEWHRDAMQEAGQSQDQLKRHAQATIEWVSAQALSETGAVQSTSVLPSTGPTFRQRLDNLLERGERFISFGRLRPSPSQSEEVQPPTIPGEEFATERAEPLTPPVVDQDRLEVASSAQKIDEQVPERPTGGETTPQAGIETTADSSAKTTDFAQPKRVEPPVLQPPNLSVYCLDAFRVYQDDQAVEGWQNSRGQTIFKYLLMHRTRPTSKEVLMDLFWPEASPEAARNNLNVAIYNMRRALRNTRPDFPHVLFQNDSYILNPELKVWVDVEEFSQLISTAQRLDQAGERAKAIDAYCSAEALYKGEFLADDRYEEWILPLRQSLQNDYVALLDILIHHYLDQKEYDLCSMMCSKLLAVDPCDEECHRNLMRCYSRQGQMHLALRQYHICVEALARELDVEPSTSTTELYTQIRQQKPV